MNDVSVNRHPDLALIIVYAVLVGVAATLWGYNYGTGNQIEQLPIVMRAMDSSYLLNDFFTNASVEFGPRLYFANFVAAFAHLMPLPAVYLVLTILGNILIALVSAFFARDLFDHSNTAALFAAAVVMSVKTFWLGGTNTLYGNFLEPSHLALPLLLGTIWAGLRQRPLLTAILAGIASLLHPLMGLETGAIMLAVMTLQCLFSRGFHLAIISLDRSFILKLATGWLIFAVYAAASLVPYANTHRIDPQLFIHIVAYFRHPHHYLPSTFGLLQYLQAAAFIFPVAIAWIDLRRRVNVLKQVELPITILVAFLLLLCLGGYVFVELLPIRIWTTAQTYRLLYIAKWLALIILAGWLARRLFARSQGSIIDRSIFGISLMSPPTMTLAFSHYLLEEHLWKNPSPVVKRVVKILLITLLIVVLVLYRVDAQVYLLYPLFVLMALCILFCMKRWLAVAVNLLVVAMVVFCLFWGRNVLPPFMQTIIAKPILTLDDLDGDKSDVAKFAREHTPKDALFLVSPKLGEFRYTAERAIVVDFKAFPFQDDAMAEWQRRLYECYVEPISTGWDAEAEMAIEFRRIDDARLSYLQSIYGFSYALLFFDTQTSFPVLFTGEMYKIVRVYPSTVSVFKQTVSNDAKNRP